MDLVEDLSQLSLSSNRKIIAHILKSMLWLTMGILGILQLYMT